MSKTVEICAFEPCPDCPWRISNRKRRSSLKVEGESYGWFTQRNRKRLWSGLRYGEAMTCHPTDTRHPGVAKDTQAKTCAGGQILQQREVMVYQALAERHGSAKAALAAYKKLRPGGMTKDGLMAVAWSAMLGTSAPLLGGHVQGRPNLMAAVEVGKLAWPAPELGLGVA